MFFDQPHRSQVAVAVSPSPMPRSMTPVNSGVTAGTPPVISRARRDASSGSVSEKAYGYGESICRAPGGRTGSSDHTLSHGRSVYGNHRASTRPVAARKRASVRRPPGRPNSSWAGTSKPLRHRSRTFSGARSVASVTKARPRWTRNAAVSGSDR